VPLAQILNDHVLASIAALPEVHVGAAPRSQESKKKDLAAHRDFPPARA
jgi:hypothetical protein